jgi:AraC-like DNA-binding protein
MLVKNELEKLEIAYKNVELGCVNLMKPLEPSQNDALQLALLKSGLELLDNKKSILIENIKIVIIEMIHYNEEQLPVNFSDYLSEKLEYDYTYLSNIFSEVKGITIQQFIILHKIEKVKELLLYDQLNLTEISYKLHYSSVAHLSNQFKKVTGITPSFFKRMKGKKIKNLEKM